MTVEIFEPAPIYTIQNAGPFEVPHPYETGTIRAAVIIDGSVEDLDLADFTVTPAASVTGGDIFLPPEIATLYDGARLTIWRETPEEQGWLGILGEREKGLEAQLDRLTMVLQELRETGSRSLRSITPIQPFAPEDGRTIIFEDGNPVPGPTVSEIAGAEGHAVAAGAAAERSEKAAGEAALYEGVWVDSAASLAPDAALHYGTGPGGVTAGDFVRTRRERYSYQVAPAAVADHHVVTAQGVKLYVMPDGDGAYPAAAMGLALDSYTNDVPRIQQLGQWIADHGGGVLRLPAGNIGWGQRLEITLPAGMIWANRYLGFAVEGAGPGLTKCFLPNTNTDGGVRITRRSRPQVVRVEGVGFYSSQPKGNNASQPATTSGIGIWIASDWNPDNPTALGWGTDPHKQVVIRNNFVGSASGLGFGRWSGCCYVEFAFFASIEGNSFENNHWGAPTDAVPHFETPPAGWDYSFGLELKECYTPEVLDNRIKGRWGYCTRIWSPYQPAFEDFAVVNNVFDGQSHIALEVACKNEGYVTPVLGEPGGRIALNHFNAHRYDVRLENIRHTSFTGNFTHLATQADLSGWFKYWDETGLRLVNCQAVQVIGNCWEEGGHYTNVNDCSRAVWLDAGCADITFDANSHGSAGIAYDCSAAEPMTITFGPGDNFGFRQGDGNWRYPAIYHHMRTNIRQRVHAPPQDISGAMAVTIGGTALAAGSYATKQAILTRRGDTAEININITLSSKEARTGQVLITGLPPHVPLYPTALTIGNMSGDTGLASHRSMRALIQANGDISIRYTDDPTSPYADAALGGAQITDTFSIVLTGTYTLAGARNIARIG